MTRSHGPYGMIGLACAAYLALAVGCTPSNPGIDAEAPSRKPQAGQRPLGHPRSRYRHRAPVSMDYEILPAPRRGQPFEVRVTVRPTTDADRVDIELAADDRLSLDTTTATGTFGPLSRGESATQIVAVTPLRDGRSYLDLFVKVERAGASRKGTFAIPIQVGPRTPVDKPPLETDAEGRPIVSMAAEQRLVQAASAGEGLVEATGPGRHRSERIME